MARNWWQSVVRALFSGHGNSRRRKTTPRPRCRPQLEVLETRLAPAFDLTIGAAATANVLHDATTGDFIATGHGATINVADIRADLLAGHSVSIRNGSTGTETGNITWPANANLDYGGVGGLELSIAVDPSATAGNVVLDSRIFDELKVNVSDALNVNVSALGNLTVNAGVAAGPADITLAASVKPDGTGTTGSGVLSIGPGVTVIGSDVTLRGADVHIDTSSNPATVTATGGKVTTYDGDIAGPDALAFDSHGNLFVANANDGTVSMVTNTGVVSTFLSGLLDPTALAFDSAGDLYVAGGGSGLIYRVTPAGAQSLLPEVFVDPNALAFDNAGNLYVADAKVAEVFVIPPDDASGSTFATGFNNVDGLAVRASPLFGTVIYVADAGNNTVTEFLSNGTPLVTFNNIPYAGALAFDGNGNLFVGSSRGNVSEIAADGTVSSIAIDSASNGLAVDSQGNLYVADMPFNIVGKVAANGLQQVAQGFGVPAALVVDASGNLTMATEVFTSVESFLTRMTAGGTTSIVLPSFAAPGGLAYDHQGNLFVSDFSTDIISKVTPTGAIVPFYQINISEYYHGPHLLAINAQDDVFFSDPTTNDVYEVSPAGKLIGTFATGFTAIDGLAFDGQGNLYVSDPGAGTVTKISPDGQKSTVVAPNLHEPAGLAFDSQGNLYIADAGKSIVYRLTPNGTLAPFYTNASGTFPAALAVDGQNNLYVASVAANFPDPPYTNTLQKISLGSVTVDSSLPSRPVNVGSAPAVAGINLTNAELARIGGSRLVIGDPTQTGAITFTDATIPTNFEVLQDEVGAGQIVLNSGGAGPAISTSGNVTLTAGQGGIVVSQVSGSIADIAAVDLSIDTTGSIGSATHRLQLQLTGTVSAGGADQPSAVWLDGVANLNLDALSGGSVDVTARGNLTVIGAVIAPGLVSLAAGVQPSGAGDNDAGTLSIGPGAVVNGGNVTLHGTNVEIDTSSNPATVTTSGTATPYAVGLGGPDGLAFDAEGNLYVANSESGSVLKITPQGAASVFASGFGLGSISALAVDSQGNIYVSTGNLDDSAGNMVYKLTPKGQISVFASLSFFPEALACDAQGNLFIGEPIGGKVVRITPTGEESTLPETFEEPAGLAFDAEGNLYVADEDTNTITKITPQGATSVQGLSFTPISLIVDAQGDLLVGSLNPGQASQVFKITPGGTVSPFATLAGLSYGVAAMALAANGNLYVGGFLGGLYRVTPHGAVSAVPTVLSTPDAVACDSQGNLYVADRVDGTVSKVTPQGTVSLFASGLGHPVALAFDAHGTLYVASNSDGTVRRITPQGTVSIVAGGLVTPSALAFDAQGNLYIADAGASLVEKLTPQGVTSVFAKDIDQPQSLAFDAHGNLYVASSGGTMTIVTPQGAVTAFADGIQQPGGMVFDTSGNLYIVDEQAGLVDKMTPQGNLSPFATGFFSPHGITVHQGNLFVAEEIRGVVSRIGLGNVTIRGSSPSAPITLGTPSTPSNGIVLSDAELAQITPTGALIVGDTSQTGTITSNGAVFVGALVLQQSRSGTGQIVLNDDGDSVGLIDFTGTVTLAPGHGGIHVVNAGTPGSTGDVVAAGLELNSPVSIGSAAQPLNVNVPYLGDRTITGNLFLSDSNDLTTGRIAVTGAVTLDLVGNCTAHAGDFVAGAVNLVFTASAGTQSFDSGNQVFTSVVHQGAGTLQLVGHGLTVHGNLTNAAGAGSFDANGQSVLVTGVTAIDGGTYDAGSAAQTFTGGLIVDASFTGGLGSVTAGGVTIAASGDLTAPTTVLYDSGNWTNSGGTFTANGGTVTLTGTNQHVSGSTTFFSLTKVVDQSDTLTFQAGSTQTVLGLLTLEGVAGGLLLLRSSIPGKQWKLTPSTSQVAFVNVEDGRDGSTTPITAAHSVGTGKDNTGWVFA